MNRRNFLIGFAHDSLPKTLLEPTILLEVNRRQNGRFQIVYVAIAYELPCDYRNRFLYGGHLSHGQTLPTTKVLNMLPTLEKDILLLAPKLLPSPQNTFQFQLHPNIP